MFPERPAHNHPPQPNAPFNQSGNEWNANKQSLEDAAAEQRQRDLDQASMQAFAQPANQRAAVGLPRSNLQPLGRSRWNPYANSQTFRPASDQINRSVETSCAGHLGPIVIACGGPSHGIECQGQGSGCNVGHGSLGQWQGQGQGQPQRFPLQSAADGVTAGLGQEEGATREQGLLPEDEMDTS